MSALAAAFTTHVTDGGPLRFLADRTRTAFVELHCADGGLSLRVGPFTPEDALRLRGEADQHPQPIRLLSAAEEREHPQRTAKNFAAECPATRAYSATAVPADAPFHG